MQIIQAAPQIHRDPYTQKKGSQFHRTHSTKQYMDYTETDLPFPSFSLVDIHLLVKEGMTTHFSFK